MDPNGSSQKNVDLYGSILKKWIQLGRLKKVDPEELLLPSLQYGIAAHEPNSRFFQSPRYRYPNPTTEKETSN